MQDTVREIPANTWFSVTMPKWALEHFQYLCTFKCLKVRKRYRQSFISVEALCEITLHQKRTDSVSMALKEKNTSE